MNELESLSGLGIEVYPATKKTCNIVAKHKTDFDRRSHRRLIISQETQVKGSTNLYNKITSPLRYRLA